MRTIWGELDINGNPVLTNMGAPSIFAAKFGSTFIGTPRLVAGQLAIAFAPDNKTPIDWTSEPYAVLCQNSAGADYGTSAKYDSSANEIYSDVTTGSGTIGTGHLTNCSGCTSCLIVITNGKQSGCDCDDDEGGSCDGSILT